MAHNTTLPKGWRELALGDVLDYEQPTAYIVTSEDYDEQYATPVLTAGKSFILGYTDEEDGICSNLPVIIFDDFTATSKYVTFPFKVKSSAMKLLTPKADDVELKFIFWLMQTIRIDSTTHKRYYLSEYQYTKIPLPPLSTQRKIVSILDKAEQATEWRKETEELTKSLLKSIFTNMFGNPVKNERGWNVVTLSDVSERIQIGPFGTQLHVQDYIDNGVPLINPTHIVKNKIVPEAGFTVSEGKFAELANYHLKTGDIVMARRGEMARCAMITSKEDGWLCGTGSLFVRPKKDIDSTFLLFCLIHETTKETLENESRGVTMSNLNLSIVGNLRLILPPLPLQLRFASIAKQVEAMQEQQRQSKKEIDNLFNALLQKAFTGELVA